MLKQRSSETKPDKKNPKPIYLGSNRRQIGTSSHISGVLTKPNGNKIQISPKTTEKEKEDSLSSCAALCYPGASGHGRLGPRFLFCPAGPKLIPPLKGTLKCLGDPLPGPPTENTPFPT